MYAHWLREEKVSQRSKVLQIEKYDKDLLISKVH